MPQSRLLVLGFDSMDVDLVRQWAAAGYLPTFRRLFESAAWTDYIDPPEHMSGRIWTSIHTGLSPLRHDFSFFMRYCRESYRMRMARPDDVRGDPFWKWFAQSGRRIVLADAPFAIPRPEYGGRQLWGWGLHDTPWRRSSVPKKLLPSLSADFGAHPISHSHCYSYSTEPDSLVQLRSGLLLGIERRTAMLKSLIADGDWDFFYGVYSEPHCAGHLMWHLEDDTHPRHRPDELAVLGHALRDNYAAIDHALGEVLACAGTDTTCAIFFSHGMGPNYHGEHLFSIFVRRFNRRWEGKSLDEDLEGERRGWFDSVWRSSIRTLPAAWRGRVTKRLPISLRGRISVLRQPGYRVRSPMLAFSLSLDVFSSLRVNLVGREPQGRIRPGEEYRRYLDAFSEELLQLTNVESGKPAVERIFRADHQVDAPTIGSMPDLTIWWSKQSPIRAIRSRTLGTISGADTEIRTGEHAMRGMLLVSHPQTKRGHHSIAGMNALDIPATLCDLAGIQPGGHLDGTSRVRDFMVG